MKDGLEILCEDRERETYVYCPAGTQQRDSSIVWLLLVVAVAIAAVGGGAIAFAMRKGSTGSPTDRR